mmetsp:Transcript_929/g.1928  ORF Transcript_929/g.1928 Transcript_929/m.1928 type:complete len:99 (-) Transcript_929:35-331(-)
MLAFAGRDSPFTLSQKLPTVTITVLGKISFFVGSKMDELVELKIHEKNLDTTNEEFKRKLTGEKEKQLLLRNRCDEENRKFESDLNKITSDHTSTIDR